MKTNTGKVETVEVTIRLPKNVVEALREFVLKYDDVTEQEFWEKGNHSIGSVRYRLHLR